MGTTEDTSAPRGPTPRDRRFAVLERYALPLALGGVIVFFSVWGETSATFATWANVKNVLGNQAVIGVMSLAILFPLVCGEFDFSVGPLAGLVQVLCAGFMSRIGMPLLLAVLLVLAIGAAVGAVTGAIVSGIGVNSLVATIGTATIASGVVTWYTESQSIIVGISDTLVDLGSGDSLGVPRTVFVLTVVALIVWYLLEQTPFGRSLHAIGSSRAAAHLVGIPVRRRVAMTFVLSGLLAGFAGILLVARNGAASPQVGTLGDSLQALTAAFLGATAIRPGRFNVPGTLVAIFFLAFTISGLSLAGVEPWINDVFTGAVLFTAVVVSTLSGRRRAATA